MQRFRRWSGLQAALGFVRFAKAVFIKHPPPKTKVRRGPAASVLRASDPSEPYASDSSDVHLRMDESDESKWRAALQPATAGGKTWRVWDFADCKSICEGKWGAVSSPRNTLALRDLRDEGAAFAHDGFSQDAASSR